MSMNAYARCISPFEIAALKRNPAAATSMATTGTLRGLGAALRDLDVALPDFDRRWPGGPPRGGADGRAWAALKQDLGRQLEGVKAATAAAGNGDRGSVLDLHKSWHALHYLFTGEADGGAPPANALLGGRELGADMGYGPPRLHEPAAPPPSRASWPR